MAKKRKKSSKGKKCSVVRDSSGGRWSMCYLGVGKKRRKKAKSVGKKRKSAGKKRKSAGKKRKSAGKKRTRRASKSR